MVMWASEKGPGSKIAHTQNKSAHCLQVKCRILGDEATQVRRRHLERGEVQA
eukprot:SAG11_NODE_34245_length_273_cov_0.591954_1_plen_51_part_10